MFKQLILAFALIFVGGTTSNAQEKTTDNFIVLEFGLGESGIGFEARKEVGLKWGIEFHHIAGCLVSENFVDSIGKLNAQTEKSIAHKYGADWKKRFEQEVGKVYQRKYQLFISKRYLEDSTIVHLDGKQFIRKIYSNPESAIFIEYFTMEGKKIKSKTSDTRWTLNDVVNPSIEVLYRGMSHNQFIDLSAIKDNTSIQCQGCQLELSQEKGLSIKAYGRAKIATIRRLINDEVIDSIKIPIQNQPQPEIHFSTNNLSDTLNLVKDADSVQLIITYPPIIKMTTEFFEMLNWSIVKEGKTLISGLGNLIKVDQLKELKKGKEYTLVCKIRNKNTDIVRRVTQSFIVNEK